MLKTDVLLLSAGFGTRLRPLTENIPKPLIKIGKKTLLEICLDRISSFNQNTVFINTHYLAEKISLFLKSYENKSNLNIKVIYEKNILDTGGALKNIMPLVSSNNIIVINSDILLGEDFNFEFLLDAHLNHLKNPIATLVLRKDKEHKKYGSIGISKENRLVSFLGKDFNIDKTNLNLMFTGVSIWSKEVFLYLNSLNKKFSLTKDLIPVLLSNRKWINSIVYNGYWSDVGTKEKLKEARGLYT